MSVLFCDVVGSTAFAEAVDAEAARETMGRYHEMAQAAVEAHGGTVAKFIGDGVMATFGIPEVAEDDAERAVAAALELQRQFVGIRDYVTDRHGFDLGMRVGVNTGEVVISAEDADLVGDALNTAARLEAECAPGRVLVGEDTWRLTRSRFSFEVLGEVTVKGKAEPVATFQVLEDEAADLTEDTTPFVGRERELAAMEAVYSAAVTDRAAKLVTVVGSPGVGKTRLAQELVRRHDEDAVDFVLRCERSGTATFAPIAQLLRTLIGSEADTDPEEVRLALKNLVADTEETSDRLVDMLAAFVGAAPARSTEEAFFAVRRLLEILGEQQPVILVVDDIQWAEPLFLDLLEHLAEWVQSTPLLVLGLARPELREIRPSLTEAGGRVEHVLAVEGLDARATEQLAAQLLGAESLPSELMERLPESTQGNPLFVREFVRMLVDDGVIAERDGLWHLEIDAGAVEVPPTIQSLLAARVERMPEDERRFIEYASVVGSEFPRGAVAAIVGDVVGGVDAMLERLRRKEVVETTGSYLGDEPVYRFHHVLIRDAAYRRVLKGARAQLHLAVGEWTERTSRDLVGEYEANIAHHYEQAQRYRTELGELNEQTAAIGERAATLLEVAATRSLERDDLSSAGSLALRALDCLSSAHPGRRDLLLIACEALLESGDVAAARPVLDELDAMTDDPRLAAWAACFDCQLIVLTAPEELSFAEAAVASAAERLEALGDQAGVAKARQIRASALVRLGRVGDCEAELELALTAARSAEDRRRITAVLGSAPQAALWGPSPIARAGGRCLDVIRLLRITTGSQQVEAVSARCQAVLEALRGKFDTARTMLESSRSTAEELGLRRGLMETELYAGIVELVANDAEAAEPHLRIAYGGLGRLGIGADAGQAAAYLARALLMQGRLDEAEELAADSDALAGQNPQTLIAARTAQAEIMSARGRHDEAIEWAEAAVSAAAGKDIIVDAANAQSTLARVRRAAGDAAGASEAQANANALLEQKGATVQFRRSGDSLEPDRAVAEDDNNVPAEDSGDQAPTQSGGHRNAVENVATSLIRRQSRATAAGDLRTWRETLEPGVVQEDLRKVAGRGRLEGVEEIFAASSFAEEQAPYSSVDVEVVAIRGERIALLEVSPETEFGAAGRLIVAVASAQGKIERVWQYDTDDFVEAVDQLEEFYVEQLSGPARERYSNYCLSWLRSIRDGDISGAHTMFGADFVSVDRSPLGWGQMDRDEWLSRMESHVESGLIDFPRAVHRLSEDLILFTLESRTVDQANIRRFVWIVQFEGDHATRAETFAEDQLDEAVARFDELAQLEPEPDDGAVREPSVARHFDTVCTRVLMSVTKWMGGTDFSQIRAAWADDGVLDDRRKVAGRGRVAGIKAIEEAWNAGVQMSMYTDVTAYPIAVRGDHLGLYQMHASTKFGTSSRLALFRLNEAGVQDLCIQFDVDDLVEALAELDRLFLEQLDGGEASTFAAQAAFHTATNGGDLEAALSYMGDSSKSVDHSRLGWGRMSRDDWVARIESHIESGLISFATTVHRLRGEWILYTQETRTLKEAGLRCDHWLVQFVDGKGVGGETFSEGQLEAAKARFEQVSSPGEARSTSSPATAGALGAGSAVTRAVEQMGPAHVVGDVATLRSVWAADGVLDDRRKVGGRGRVVGLDAIAETWKVSADLDMYTDVTGVPVAMRGDRLGLLEMRPSTEFGSSPRLVLVRINAAGLHDLTVQFDVDDLAEALLELDQLYVEELDGLEAETFRRYAGFFSAVAESDLAGAMELVPADGVVSNDHTELGWGELDAAGWAERIQSLIDMDLVAFLREVHAIKGEHLLVTAEVCNPDRSAATRTIWVVHLGDGDGLTGEAFPEDQFTQAQARFQELTGVLGDSPSSGSIDRGEAATVVFEITNQAARVDARLSRGMFEGDKAAVSEVVAPDFVVENRRTGLNSGRTSTIESFFDSLDEFRKLAFSRFKSVVIAVRGERLCLTRFGASTEDDYVIENLAVVSLNADRRVGRTVMFDVEHLPVALAELESLYLEGEGAADVEHLSPIVAFEDAANQLPRDIDAIRATLSPDYVAVDHRPLGFPELGREAFLESRMTALNDQSGSFVYTARIHRMAGPLTLRTICSGGRWQDASYERRWLQVQVVEDGKCERSESFDEADGAAALARFDEFAAGMSVAIGDTSSAVRFGGRGLVNRGTELSKRFSTAFVSGDFAALESMLHPDFVATDRRRDSLARGYDDAPDVLGGLRAMVDVGLDRIEEEVMAIRGDHLSLAGHRLVQRSTGNTIERLMVTRSTDEDVFDFSASFHADDMSGAFVELERLYAEELSAEQRAVHEASITWYRKLSEGDAERVLAMMAPDHVLIDHSPLGWPQLDREQWARRLSATDNVSEKVVQEVHAISSNATLHTLFRVTEEPYTERIEIWLAVMEDGRFIRSESWGEDQLEEAMARFEEVSQIHMSGEDQVPQETAELGRSRPLSNRCTEVSDRMHTAFAVRDFSTFENLVSPEVVAEDYRGDSLAGGHVGREALMKSIRATAEVGFDAFEQRVIAVRGDNLALVEFVVGDGSDRVIERLMISRLDEKGLVDRSSSFDMDDLASALTALDNLYAEELPDQQRAVLEAHALWYDHMGRGDAESANAMMSQDFVAVDHSPLGWPDMDLDMWKHRMKNQLQHAERIVEQIHAVSANAVLTTLRRVTRDPDTEQTKLWLSQIENGQSTRVESWAEDQFDEAMARFDEISRRSASDDESASEIDEELGLIDTLCTRAFKGVSSAFVARDWDRYRELLTEEVVALDERPDSLSRGHIGRDAVLRSIRSMAEVGFDRIEQEVLAVRGEELSLVSHLLVQSDTGHNIERLMIHEVDADGRYVRVISFDPLDLATAVDRLNGLYVDRSPPELAGVFEVAQRGVDGLNRGDLASVASVLAPELVVTDHQSLGWPVLDRDGYLHRVGSMASVVGGGGTAFTLYERVHRLTSKGFVPVAVTRTATPYSVTRRINVAGVTDGRVTSLDVFDVADLDEALQLFDRELAEIDDSVDNECMATLARLSDRFASRDWVGCAWLVSDGMTGASWRDGETDGAVDGGDDFISR
ncbi:MAG: AAA family ATPase, partial [Acidimicrobiales bacterium]